MITGVWKYTLVWILRHIAIDDTGLKVVSKCELSNKKIKKYQIIKRVKRPTLPRRCRQCRRNLLTATTTVTQCCIMQLVPWCMPVHFKNQESNGMCCMTSSVKPGYEHSLGTMGRHTCVYCVTRASTSCCSSLFIVYLSSICEP